MYKPLILFVILLGARIGLAQLPTSNDDFPVYHPNQDIADVPANAMPYYYADPAYAYTYCSSPDICWRETHQYAFGEGRQSEDGNSDIDIFYSDHWDQELAPNGKPLILLLHGGNGTRNTLRLAMRAISFAQRGYVAIIADYRTPRDEIFEECLDQREAYFSIQASVLDARAALRRTLYLSSLPNANFKVDPTKIFLDGITWGSLTSYHMAVMDAADFPSGTVEINGVTYNFEQSLDALLICDDPQAPCNTYQPFPGYDIADHIMGLTARNIYVLDLDYIDSSDQAPTLFLHGSCDTFSPFFSRTAKEANYANHIANGFPPESAPCQDEEQYGYEVFGGELMYERVRTLGGGNPSFPTRYFRMCGEDHTLDSYTIFRVCQNSVDCIRLNMLEYETIRFFAEILNGTAAGNDIFHIDHTLLSVPDVNAVSHCAALPSATSQPGHPSGQYFPQLAEICPTCTGGSEVYNGLLRLPYFSAVAGDDNRYPLIDDCVTLSSDDFVNRRPSKVRVFDFMGYVRYEAEMQGGTDLTSFLRSAHGLPPGLYAVHLEGQRYTICIR